MKVLLAEDSMGYAIATHLAIKLAHTGIEVVSGDNLVSLQENENHLSQPERLPVFSIKNIPTPPMPAIVTKAGFHYENGQSRRRSRREAERKNRKYK